MRGGQATPGTRPAWRIALAAGIYLALTLWTVRALLPSPSTLSTLRVGRAPNAISNADLAVMVWSTNRNARTLVTHPWRLPDFETCYPTARGAGFGAPYFMDGVLAVPATLLGAPPLLVYNSVVVLALWCAAMAMFLLADYWTRDFGAALLAGIAFAFHPGRILGAQWPHVYGNQWTPLVLLFTYRLFARGTWVDAAGLMVFLGLQILGCFYQFLPLVALEGTVVLVLAFHHRARLLALVPKLLAVAAAALACGAVQFLPALHVQQAWGTMTGRFNAAHPIERFLPGGPTSVGVVVLVLVAVALLDRVRTRRTVSPDDPRLALLVAGLLVMWMVVFTVPIPGTGIAIPNLLVLVGRAIPGFRSVLEAVRGVSFGFVGVYVASGLLAAFGVAALRRGRGPLASRALAAALVGLVLAEIYVPALAARSFAIAPELEAHDHGLDPALTTLERRMLTGPVIDLPAGREGVFRLFPNSHAIMLAAYHRQPVAACYNSFTSPLSEEIWRLGDRLPDPQAADDLVALGFENVVVHGDVLGAGTQATLDRLRGPEAASRLTEVGAAAGHWIFALRSPRRVVGTLPPAVETPPAQSTRGPLAEVGFTFRNAGEDTYRHPDPIEPSAVVARWSDAAGARVAEESARLLLPIALAPGEEVRRTLRLSVPAIPGRYRVTLARAAAPADVVALASVTVDSAP